MMYNEWGMWRIISPLIAFITHLDLQHGQSIREWIWRRT